MNRKARHGTGKAPAQQQVEQLIGLCRAQRFREAAPLAKEFTRKWPRHAVGWHALAACMQARGDITEAVRAHRQALKLEPENADGHNNLGLLLLDNDRSDEAAGSFRRALRIRPGFTVAHYNLGLALEAIGDLEGACRSLRQAIEIQPDFAEAYNHLGNALLGLGHHADASDCYRRSLELQPDHAEVHGNLGNALAEQGATADAEACLRRAIELRPDYAEGHANLGNLLRTLGRLAESESALQYAVELRPDDPALQSNLAATLLEKGEVERAIQLYRQALDRRPGSAEARENLGNALADLGDREAATAAYREALSLQPDRARVHYHLSLVKRFERDDADRQAIERLLTRDDLAAEDRVYLEYAAGKALADVGDDPAAIFAHYSAGARHKRESLDYEVSRDEAWLASIAHTFTPELLDTKAGAGDTSGAPIFIVGMPRSGTTLIEQMLAAHPRVHGAGERPDLRALIERTDRDREEAFPYWVAALEPGVMQRLGEEYRHMLADSVAGADRVTDKMPANFACAGLIRLILPNARIIHVRRDPADTCVSCFTYLFSGRQAFTYDLRELGRYYRAYDALMAHWREVLPGDFLLEVPYEGLVEDPARWIEQMLSHCGLEWDEACLQFHRSERAVRTASADQVRQPLYRSAIGRWRAYREHLGPLFEALGPLAPPDARS